MMFITFIRLVMGEEKGEAYLRDLSKQNVANLTGSPREVVNKVMQGECAIAIDIFLHHPVISAQKGAPVAPQPLEPVMSNASVVTLAKGTTHPHAAMLLIDYLLSKEAQQVLEKADYLPAHPDVKPQSTLARHRAEHGQPARSASSPKNSCSSSAPNRSSCRRNTSRASERSRATEWPTRFPARRRDRGDLRGRTAPCASPPAGRRRSSSLIALLLLLIVPPLYFLLKTSLYTTNADGSFGDFTLEYYRDLLSSPRFVEPFPQFGHFRRRLGRAGDRARRRAGLDRRAHRHAAAPICVPDRGRVARHSARPLHGRLAADPRQGRAGQPVSHGSVSAAIRRSSP